MTTSIPIELSSGEQIEGQAEIGVLQTSRLWPCKANHKSFDAVLLPVPLQDPEHRDMIIEPAFSKKATTLFKAVRRADATVPQIADAHFARKLRIETLVQDGVLKFRGDALVFVHDRTYARGDRFDDLQDPKLISDVRGELFRASLGRLWDVYAMAGLGVAALVLGIWTLLS